MKCFVVSLLLLSCFTTVFGEEAEAIIDGALPPHHRGGSYPPVEAPAPSHHHHHHHHHHHQPPTHPPVHPPTHPPHHPPAHYPPSPPPMHPPVHVPSHPPTHPPVHVPSHPPTHPPVHPPMHPPTRPPVHAPGHPPAHPPIHFPPRSLVAVQGVVYCKPCKYRGIATLLGASPLLGATVKLQCNNTKYPLVVLGKTDKNGYFFIQAPKKITTYGAHKCKVSLVSSSSPTCNLATDLHFGLKGAILRPEKPPAGLPPPPYVTFSVGPFAFEPAKKVECPR
ncbi:non-classical arabinogalactan protein 31 [Vitis riparia]|uniref:non-classical arabinogalactan protein 31 n=1 Tax=Vitis riparia TaxID=96939 RepID=UPI00155A6B2B|nr:non-classical arabinogalactan protein 31 [Vitis riparia]